MLNEISHQAPEYHCPERCRSMGTILDRIGDKWAVMVVGTLSHGSMRFNAIMRQIGSVSHRMLTLTLRGLERDGLVRRTAYPTSPPRVEYELTDLGRSLIEPLRTLGQWAAENRSAIEEARIEYDGLNQRTDRPNAMKGA